TGKQQTNHHGARRPGDGSRPQTGHLPRLCDPRRPVRALRGHGQDQGHDRHSQRTGRTVTRRGRTRVDDRARFVITADAILTLARWAYLVEAHHSEGLRRATPMDLEWAKVGRTGELFILQASPETVQSRRPAGLVGNYHRT